jgi:hypothetical protein
MKNPALAALALVALAVAPAGEAQDGAAYYGISLGEFAYNEGDGAGGDLIDDTVSSWRLMINYQFMEHLAVEGALGQTGTIHDTFAVPVFPAGTVDLSISAEFSRMLTVRLLGLLPFDNGLSLMGGVGYTSAKFEIDLSDGVNSASADEDRNDPGYYVGVQYDWERFAMRLGYEKFDYDGDADADETMLSFFYKL